MGAGTGYWAALLRQRGVDILALDYHPPKAITPDVLSGEGNLFFQGTYTDVAAGVPADLAAHSDRVLMLCWPYNEIEARTRGGDEWDATCLAGEVEYFKREKQKKTVVPF